MEITASNKVLESQALVRFPDCDPFNHLNNSKYIDYIINAREDQLITHYGLDVYKIARETGISWVVSQTQIAYLASAELMETVTIETKLISFTDKHLLVEAIMWDKEKKQMKTVVWIRFTHFNLVTKKSHRHSEEFQQLFAGIVYPLAEKSFEERLKGFQQQKATAV